MNEDGTRSHRYIYRRGSNGWDQTGLINQPFCTLHAHGKAGPEISSGSKARSFVCFDYGLCTSIGVGGEVGDCDGCSNVVAG